MSASTISSSPSSEVTAKPHPYHCEKKPGAPRGAYEARRAKRGLYVRVDMPGVPNDGVKVVKYNDTRTVTFSGKALPSPGWSGSEPESDTRVYGGYVVVDRDLADVEFESHFKYGCLRLFFPCCDGSLHFLSPPPHDPFTPLNLTGPNGEEMVCPSHVSFIVHDESASSGIKMAGGSPEDINPYQLSGVRGVYEHKIVNVEAGEAGDQMIYVRLDVPDTCKKESLVFENMSSTRGLVFGASAFKNEYYSRFDEAAREYSGTIMPNCKCPCNYSLIRFENENGVLRVLVCKSGTDPDPNPVVHCLMASSTQGRDFIPSSVKIPKIPEHVPGTLKPQPKNRSNRPGGLCVITLVQVQSLLFNAT